MRALVSGAHGFIGSHIVDRLLQGGLDVRALVSPWGRTDNLGDVTARAGLKVVSGDVTDPATLVGTCEGCEVVYHAAARAKDWGSWSLFERVNVEGTRNLLREAERAQVRRFVQVSSVAVHAYTGHFEADPRTTPRTGRVGSYPRSKRMAEALVAAASIPEVVVVRPGLWPFGARDPNFMALVAPLQAGKLPLVAGGRSRLNTAYLENLAEGLFLAGTVPGAAGRTYVIADEGAPTWREALGHLAQLLGAPPPGPSVPGWLSRATGAVVEATWALARPGREPPLTAYRGGVMCHDVHFSIDAARHELGYAPAIDWREGLERTLAAFGRNR